jgi:8-oxo-dGTP diphosphatase
MSTAAAAKPVEVVAAVVTRPNAEFLLAQRPAGKVYAGYWEFPGGKVEPGEPPTHALKRELHEELGIGVIRAWPWIVREHVYSHAHVRLNFFRVVQWQGEPSSREAQRLSWQQLDRLGVGPMLPANGPILRALSLPPVLAITDAWERGVDNLLERLEQRLAQGLRMVIVREKQMPRDRLRDLVREVLWRCRAVSARVLVNGDAELAVEASADGLHLTSAQLLDSSTRPAVPWCGASCHSLEEMRRAADLGLDYILLGPVLDTPTHPGTLRLGWEGFAQFTSSCPVPVYALGGMTLAHLDLARAAGAHGVAMMRGAWDPVGPQSFPLV